MRPAKTRCSITPRVCHKLEVSVRCFLRIGFDNRLEREFTEAELVHREVFKPERECRRLRSNAVIALFRIDEHWVGENGMNVVPHRLPRFQRHRFVVIRQLGPCAMKYWRLTVGRPEKLIIDLPQLVGLVMNAMPYDRLTGVHDNIAADDVAVFMVATVLARRIGADADVVFYEPIEPFAEFVATSEAKVVEHVIV